VKEVRYLDLPDFLVIAEAVLDMDAEEVAAGTIDPGAFALWVQERISPSGRL